MILEVFEMNTPQTNEAHDTARLNWLESQSSRYGDGRTEPRQACIVFTWSQSPDEGVFPGLRDAIDHAMKRTSDEWWNDGSAG
jgi:hypothetical protein